MKIRRILCVALLSSGLVIAPGLAVGGQSGSTTIDPAKGGGNSQNDVTRKIHRALVTDKSLSSYARSVKVMAVGNLVMVRGPVRSERERKAVLALAKKYAGDTNVVDQTIIAK